MEPSIFPIKISLSLCVQDNLISTERIFCLHFEVVGGLERSNDPESYAGGSVATGRVSQVGEVKGDGPD